MYENFYNLSRNEKYDMIFKKTLEIIQFVNEKNYTNYKNAFKMSLVGAVLGVEKMTYTLNYSAFLDSLTMWSTSEQNQKWKKLMKENCIFGTYIQTELG
jgi:hypothetical protein